jgi:DNA repair protein RecO (recombination protein O)
MPTRDRVYRTEAIVLRHGDLGEADRILSVYTPERGKLRLVAKGVRRARSRKAGHLEPLSRVQLLIARGRELDIITQAEAVELYAGLREDLVRLASAEYIVELLDRFTVEEAETHGLYRLLRETLERLTGDVQPTVVLRFFELRLLELSGFRPELFRCLGCQSEVRPQDQFFSYHEGGVLCPDCGPRRRDARRLSLAGLKVLRHYQRNTFAVAAAPRVRPEVQEELEALMEGYLSHLLERKMNVPAFLRQVRRLEQREASLDVE